MTEQIKVTRKEILEMAFGTKQKLNKLLFLFTEEDVLKIYYTEFNSSIYKAGIWLDVYADSFNKDIAVESDELKEVADTGTIHNANLKIEYRLNFLSSIAARLIKYGEKCANGEQAHALLKALDYVKEAIGFLGLMK